MFVGIDVGGTKVLAIAGRRSPRPPDAADGPPIELGPDARVPTAAEPGALLDTLVGAVAAVVPPGEALSGVAVGIAGLVDRDGTVRYSPHLPDVVELPLRDQLAARLGVAVQVENDATTATVGEAHFGAGRGRGDFVFVALGTGIGTKFLVDGRVVRGAHGFAGEAGHATIDKHGPRHVTGLPGPWERYASGSALGRLAREVAAAGRAPRLVALAGAVEAIDGEHVHAAVTEGDPDALAVLDAFADDVGVGLAMLVAVLDPTCVVLGGGVSEMGEPLRVRVEAALARWTIGREHRPPVPVLRARLGERAGALGALAMAAGLDGGE